MTDGPVLKIENLHTYFHSRSKQAFVRSVDGVYLDIEKGETLGVVGESGSGKSVTAHSVMGLVTAAPCVIMGKIGLKTAHLQKNLLQDLPDYVKTARLSGRIMDVYKAVRGWQKHVDRIMKGVRGKEVSMIFQNPKLAFNPFITVGRQIRESIQLSTAIKHRVEARERALYWLEKVKIDSPRMRYHNNPFGMSGGMCQRAMIAMALASEPSLLIADEPTTGLDATIQSKIVDLLAEIKVSLGLTTMLISHDIDVIKALSDRVAVMYGGTILEHGPVGTLLSAGRDRRHPYTEALLASIPSRQQIKAKAYLQAIRGEVLDTINLPEGCRFYPRCHRKTDAVDDLCRRREPDLMDIATGHKVRCWLYDD
jgi:peptide/nickel transport system ATP-binding protein